MRMKVHVEIMRLRYRKIRSALGWVMIGRRNASGSELDDVMFSRKVS